MNCSGLQGRLSASLFGVLRGILTYAVMILAAGCAGHPKDVLLPVAATSLKSSRVEMLVATTRCHSTVPGEMFTGERGSTPAFADISVSIPASNARKVGEVAWPKKLPPNPATDFATLKADKVTRGQAKAWLSASVRRSPDRSVSLFTDSTTGSRILSIVSRRSFTMQACTALPFWSHGRHGAARSHMDMITKAPITRGAHWKCFLNIWRAIPR